MRSNVAPFALLALLLGLTAASPAAAGGLYYSDRGVRSPAAARSSPARTTRAR